MTWVEKAHYLYHGYYRSIWVGEGNTDKILRECRLVYESLSPQELKELDDLDDAYLTVARTSCHSSRNDYTENHLLPHPLLGDATMQNSTDHVMDTLPEESSTNGHPLPSLQEKNDAAIVNTLQNEETPQKHRRHGSRQRNVFTTGQVARICQVAPRTVSKWFDMGKLPGFRIPGSNDRRIPRRNLLKFLRENQIDISWLLHLPWETVLLVGVAPLLFEAVQKELTDTEGYRVVGCSGLVEAAILAGEVHPNLAVIDMWVPEARNLAQSLCKSGTICLALVTEDNGDATTWTQHGFADSLQNPVSPQELLRVVKRLLHAK